MKKELLGFSDKKIGKKKLVAFAFFFFCVAFMVTAVAGTIPLPKMAWGVLVAVLAAILNALEPLYHDWLVLSDLEPFLAYWDQYDLLRGKTITVLRPADRLTGTVLGLTAEGRLRLAVPGRGEVVVDVGDVHLEKA